MDALFGSLSAFFGEHPFLYRISVATALGLVFFAVIFALERYYGESTDRYRSRNFAHDVVYWFYVRTGLHATFFTGWVYIWAYATFPQLNINLIGGLPGPARYLLYFLLMDLAGYWYHRWKHHNPILWAFHSTHHSQQQMTFATLVRGHVLDDFLNTLVVFAPIMVLGAHPADWRWVAVLRLFLEALQHSAVPWRFGPLYRVFVSPVFHSFHHSARREHYNSNYGSTLSIWDYMFGTAIEDAQRPTEFGVRDVQMPTLASQFFVPFRMAYDSVVSSRQMKRRTAAPIPSDRPRATVD